MAYPGIACVLIGITVATILYYIFGNEERERDAYAYENNTSRYRESNYYQNGYDSGFHRNNISDSTDFDDCTICMNSLAAGRKIILKNCNHVFHQDCISGWKYKSEQEFTCPNCRRRIE